MIDTVGIQPWRTSQAMQVYSQLEFPECSESHIMLELIIAGNKNKGRENYVRVKSESEKWLGYCTLKMLGRQAGKIKYKKNQACLPLQANTNSLAIYY